MFLAPVTAQAFSKEEESNINIYEELSPESRQYYQHHSVLRFLPEDLYRPGFGD